jgi:diadenosine tetraphosphate (Ap4A) HIT family hydrolase
MTATDCVLGTPQDVSLEHPLAFVRRDDDALSPGHVLVIPHRHVANFFDMTTEEKHAILELLDRARVFIDKERKPDGYNIGVNIGTAGGQSRMHVHVHLIPRYNGDHPNPRRGVRCVLSGTCKV